MNIFLVFLTWCILFFVFITIQLKNHLKINVYRYYIIISIFILYLDSISYFDEEFLAFIALLEHYDSL